MLPWLISACPMAIDTGKEALEASRARGLRQESALIALTQRAPRLSKDALVSLHRLTEAAAQALDVERVSVWRYQAGNQTLRAVDLYDSRTQAHSATGELAAASHPDYFRALADCDVIAADDAVADPRTREFSNNDPKSPDTTSRMDVPIRLDGRLDGVLCHEHAGPKRQWTVDERTFVLAIANLVALEFEEVERKQTGAALHQSEQAFASLVNTIGGIVWEADAQSLRFTFASPQAERCLGYPTEQWLAEPNFWEEHLHWEDREWAMNHRETAAREGRNHDFQYRMIAANGRVVWLHDLVTLVREGDQKARLRGIMLDITESKRVEEALRWRTTFFEAQVDSSLDGILVVDSQGKKILQNQRMTELWKIPPSIAEDPDNAKQFQFLTSRTKHPKEFVKKVKHLYAHTDEVSHDEVELVDGTVLDRYSSPVRDKLGKYYGRIWSFRDITERKHLEEQLRQAQKMEAVGQLAGGVAHDFNNILTATMMHLGLLRTSLQDQKTKDAVKELETQAQRAANLTRQLLMFSRQSAVEIKPLDLNLLVENLLKMLRRLIGEQVNIEFRSQSALSPVEADAGMMEQVLMNLAVNARDAMSGRGRLIISTAEVEIGLKKASQNPVRRAGRFVRLSVADTGCGMDEETKKRIFEPFFTTKPVGKGTGLGLATVYGIVQQHHGWLEVESEVGEGSTFHLFLPVTEEYSAEESKDANFVLPGGTETILFVEDETAVRLVTVRCLRMLGYRVVEASNGKEAMALWAQHRDQIALLFSDMIMPEGITGLELAERFTREMSGLKVIIASGYSSEEIPSLPEILFLPKPFKTEELAAAVRASLDRT